MASFEELAEIRRDRSHPQQLEEQIRVACFVAADAISETTDPQTNTPLLAQWVRDLYDDNQKIVSETFDAVLALRSGDDVATIRAWTDADVQGYVDQVIGDAASGYVAGNVFTA